LRKRTASIAAGLVALGLAGLAPAIASAGNPSGSNPPNTFGLCTAADNGNKNGWNNQPNGAPPPFQTLEQQGESEESQQTQSAEQQSGTEGTASDARQDIEQACASDGVTPGGQGHGGP
jgi:hypothetical protein